MLKSKNVNNDLTMNPPIHITELTKKLIKIKRDIYAGTVGKIIPTETIRRTAHHLIESPIALGG